MLRLVDLRALTISKDVFKGKGRPGSFINRNAQMGTWKKKNHTQKWNISSTGYTSDRGGGERTKKRVGGDFS